MEDVSLIKYSIYSMVGKCDSIKQSTLYHLLNGKRTSYMLYYAYSNNISGYYALFPTLKIEQFNDIIAQMILDNQLNLVEEQYLAQAANQVEYLGANLLEELWAKDNEFDLISPKLLEVWIKSFQLLAQVVGNSSYQEYQYAPVNDNVIIQQAFKKWLKLNRINLKNKNQLKQIIDELESILKSHSDSYNLLLLSMIDTKHVISTTTEQRIKQNLEITQSEMRIIEQLIWIRLFADINTGDFQLPLLNSWYRNQLAYFGVVSNSCRQTEILYQQGYEIEQIIIRRNLKQTTIQDHLIELAICSNKDNFTSLLPSKEELKLWQTLQDDPTLAYKTYYEQYPEQQVVSFFEYRLLQIYQMKNKV